MMMTGLVNCEAERSSLPSPRPLTCSSLIFIHLFYGLEKKVYKNVDVHSASQCRHIFLIILWQCKPDIRKQVTQDIISILSRCKNEPACIRFFYKARPPEFKLRSPCSPKTFVIFDALICICRCTERAFFKML